MLKDDIAKMETAKDKMKESINNISKDIKNKTGNEINKLSLINNFLESEDIQDGYVKGDIIKHGNFEEVYSGSENEYIQSWEFVLPTWDIKTVDVDSFGNAYTTSEYGKITKISKNGSKVWDKSIDSVAFSIKVDKDNSFFVAQGGTNGVIKFGSDGEKVWTKKLHGGATNSVAIDSISNIYTGSDDKKVIKSSNDGQKIWEFTGHRDYVYSVDVDIDGNVYSGSRDKKVMKISSDGKQIWEFTGHTNAVSSVSTDSEKNIYSGSYDKKVMKISDDGKKIWEFTGHTGAVNCVTVSEKGDIFSSGTDGFLFKINKEGVKLSEVEKYEKSISSIATWGTSVYSSNANSRVLKHDEKKELQGYKILKVE